MNENYSTLSDYLLKKVETISADKKYLIALGGAPGSGKTTSAIRICDLLNLKKPGICAMLPMDGFHYYKAELDKMKDPAEAYRRRGAEWTFNAEGFLTLLQKIRQDGEAKAPSFDHTVGDPIEDDIIISKHHKIIIAEGNYLLLDKDPWRDIAHQFDELWFIDCNLDIAMERVRIRHMNAWNFTDAQARERIATNDRINAELIQNFRLEPDKIIKSV